jgi:MtrB/PioB family decaheme-associated outer membrane protein
MTTCRVSRTLPVLALGLALGLGSLLAEDGDTLEGEVIVGPQYFAATDNRDSAKFEEFRDVPNDLVVGRVFLAWTPRPGWFFALDAIDTTQDDQRLAVEFGRRDKWRGAVRWTENPRRWTDQAFMLFTNNSDALFTLEDSFQSAVRAAPASALPGGDLDGDGLWDPGSKGFVINSAIENSAPEVLLEHQRELGEVALEFTPTRHWIFRTTAARERRAGSTPQNLGMYFSLAPAEVAAPLDFRTDTATASAEYVAPRFHVGVQLAASNFESGTKGLTWDDQLFLVDELVNVNTANPAQGRLTFATDNELRRVGLTGGVDLGARTRLDATYSWTETTQDDPFLPMTINSLLIASPLPATSLDGKHETTSAQLRLVSRPSPSWRWSAWWRSYDLENQTPSLTFQDTVTTDYQFPLCGNVNLPCDVNDNDVLDDRLPRRSLPYSYSRSALGGQVGWSPVRRFDAALSFEREEIEREFSAVEDATEDTFKLTLDYDAADWLALRGTLRFQERRADEYDAHYLEESFPNGEPYVAPFNEGSRRYYWTDRDRNAYALQVDATPAANWGVHFEATFYDDDYFDPETGQPIGSSFTVQEDRNFDTVLETYDILLAGRTQNEGDSYSIGFTYSAAPRFDVYADYTIENFEYALASRYRNVSGGVGTDDPLDNWSSAADDDYDTVSAGFRWAISADKTWNLRGDASRSEGTSLITTDFVPGGASSGDTTLTSFPEVDARLNLVNLMLERMARTNLGYALLYTYESWHEDNFASDFNEPYMGQPNSDPGSSNSIFLGIDFKNYANHILSFQLRYRF